MTGRFSVKFGGRKAAFIVTAALAAVVIATTLLLSACAVTLHFGGKGGILSYLEGKTVTAPADFRKKYFGK